MYRGRNNWLPSSRSELIAALIACDGHAIQVLVVWLKYRTVMETHDEATAWVWFASWPVIWEMMDQWMWWRWIVVKGMGCMLQRGHVHPACGERSNEIRVTGGRRHQEGCQSQRQPHMMPCACKCGCIGG
eukprot:scaffold20050_cov57-Attheya_sp.AAC.2